MSSLTSFSRTLLIYGVIILSAVGLGYQLTAPEEVTSFLVFLGAACVLAIPLLMHSHYTLLLFSWNAMICVFFLPGQPFVWMLMTLVSLGFTVANHVIRKQKMFVLVPSVTAALGVVVLVVFLTAFTRGGMGMRVLGGDTYGGKGFIFILFAVAGYFALTSSVIPRERVPTALGWFFLSGLTAIMGHVILLGGPGFYFLFNIFPTGVAQTQYVSEMSGGGMVRYAGVPTACVALFSYMLARYGIRGVFTLHHPFRFLMFVVTLALVPLGGYRSILAWVMLVFAVQFICEGLFRPKYLLAALGVMVLGIVLLAPVARVLPLSMQRAISFLPVRVDPGAKFDAESSTAWRLEIWKTLLPQLPQYIFVGKGYTLDPTDLYMAQEGIRRGFSGNHEVSLVAGDYHNGFLSVYVPLGGSGLLAFAFFLAVGTRLLYRNYRYGDPALKQVNTLLLSMFVARIIFFAFIFGVFSYEFYSFTGAIGLSIALNGGECKPADPNAPRPRPVESDELVTLS